MSSYLYRLGRAAATSARWVIIGWVVLLLALGGAAVALGGSLEEDLTIPGTESQTGIDQLDERFPLLAGTSGQLLFVAPEGESIADHADEVRAVLDEVEQVDHVATVVDPFAEGNEINVADDGRHALAQVLLDVKLDGLGDETVPALEEAAQLPDGSELDVHLGGSVFTTTGVAVSATEGLGVVIALVVLAITFGSLLTAGMPILTAVLGVGVTMAGLLAVASATTITSTTPTLALMIGLAVGIDYALFIVYRHRTQLAQGMAVTESVARSVATSGSAVIFAGATVVIALCGLAVARIPFLTVMGLAAASGVAVAVVVAVTLVPALLAVFGEKLRPRRGSRAARRATAEPTAQRTLGARWVRAVTAVPVLTVVVTAAALLVLAVPAKDLALGLPDNGMKEPGSAPRETYDLVSETFGQGFNSPLLVTGDIIASLDPLTLVDDLRAEVAALDGVAAVPMATPNPSADLAIIQVVPEAGQTDPETAQLVHDLRALGDELEQEYEVSNVVVTGQTAVAIDVSERLSAALLPFGLVVVGLSMVLLTLVFRSIAVPLKATVGYLLSVLASFGVVAAIFEWGWAAEALNVAKVGPVISFMPIVLMGVLFGLAMDYEVFLVSQMREEFVHTGDARRSVTTGFTASARVVTAAAVIMIAVFAAFVPHADPVVKPIAVGLAVGVFIDAFLVRMTLVPAVMALLGDRAWWLPRRLDRVLPHLDVEGEGLAHHVEHEEWVAEHGPAAVRALDLVLTDEHDDALLDPLSLVVRPGALQVVTAQDRVARRALLAAVAGRLPARSGTLLVLDRLLPEESAPVRSSVWWFPTWPGAEQLAALPEGTPLVVVDGLDVPGPLADSVRAERWSALAALAARGTTVVVGADNPPDRLLPAEDHTHLHLLAPAHRKVLA
ncbi:MMPL family transporter [Nocardioides sp. Y6]|uniref:MMPL family transporter n=1 Tax=Nocardioides malaquae TaxID=2773426 RepID=A0ABR9RT61_9ACTN|nr:MMPL family transporter [Nocardioides malaquae]MBE7324773.1 MMPL family transporter [Nocardioides malaquae]